MILEAVIINGWRVVLRHRRLHEVNVHLWMQYRSAQIVQTAYCSNADHSNSLWFHSSFTVTAVLNMHIEPRNLFAERACCRRQSHFIYIGQGEERVDMCHSAPYQPLTERTAVTQSWPLAGPNKPLNETYKAANCIWTKAELLTTSLFLMFQ